MTILLLLSLVLTSSLAILLQRALTRNSVERRVIRSFKRAARSSMIAASRHDAPIRPLGESRTEIASPVWA